MSGGSLNVLTLIVGIILSVLVVYQEFRTRKISVKYGFEQSVVWLSIAKAGALVVVINLFTFVIAQYNGIPNILVILLVLIAIYSFVMNHMTMGRHIYALGGNEKAASLSGVKTKRVTFWVFVNMGVLAALSGLVFAARLNSATPKAGTNFELDAIAACFIGGASASGGIGTVVGAIIGGW